MKFKLTIERVETKTVLKSDWRQLYDSDHPLMQLTEQMKKRISEYSMDSEDRKKIPQQYGYVESHQIETNSTRVFEQFIDTERETLVTDVIKAANGIA